MRHEEEPTDGNRAALNSGTGRDVSLRGLRPRGLCPAARGDGRRCAPASTETTERRDHHSDARASWSVQGRDDPEQERPEDAARLRRPRPGRQPRPPVRELRRQDLQHRRLLRQRRGGVPRGLPAAAGEPHQYRWLGPNGTKWGLDKDRDGKHRRVGRPLARRN